MCKSEAFSELNFVGCTDVTLIFHLTQLPLHHLHIPPPLTGNHGEPSIQHPLPRHLHCSLLPLPKVMHKTQTHIIPINET